MRRFPCQCRLKPSLEGSHARQAIPVSDGLGSPAPAPRDCGMAVRYRSGEMERTALLALDKPALIERMLAPRPTPSGQSLTTGRYW